MRRTAMLLMIVRGTVLVMLAACRVGPSTSASPSAAASGQGIVRSVVDGDTLVVSIDGAVESVRLIGIDTPETKDPRKTVECFGPDAAAHTAALLAKGAAVRLERDVEARDSFGRLLAYVWRASDGLFVNSSLVRDGYARLLTIPPNVAYTSELAAAEQEARQANRGLWGACQ